MSPSKAWSKRRLHALETAFDAFDDGLSLTNAAKLVNLPRGTFYYKHHHRTRITKQFTNQPTFDRTQLTKAEEKIIVALCV